MTFLFHALDWIVFKKKLITVAFLFTKFEPLTRYKGGLHENIYWNHVGQKQHESIIFKFEWKHHLGRVIFYSMQVLQTYILAEIVMK